MCPTLTAWYRRLCIGYGCCCANRCVAFTTLDVCVWHKKRERDSSYYKRPSLKNAYQTFCLTTLERKCLTAACCNIEKTRPCFTHTHTHRGLVLHVAINYKEDELTIFFVVFVLFKNWRARRAGESFGSFFLFLFAYDIFMCGLFLCRPPHLYTAHFYIIDPTIYTEEKKTKKNIFLFLFYLFFVNILLLLRFF